MKEGWLGDDHLVLFDAREVKSATERYGLNSMLPDYELVGLRGWDEFIVRHMDDRLFIVPTVPCDNNHLAPIELPLDSIELDEDRRFVQKIKWYSKPIVFGGDPQCDDNIAWVDYEQHAQLFGWWNQQYRAMKRV